MSFASPYFLTWDNVRAMLLSFSIEGIVVVGMTILLIVGGKIIGAIGASGGASQQDGVTAAAGAATLK